MKLVLAIVMLLACSWCGAASAATQCPSTPVQCTQAEAYGDAERQAKERAAVVCVAPTYNGMLTFRVNGPTGSVDAGSYSSDFTCRLPNGTSAGPNSSGISAAFYKNVCTTRADVLQTNQPNGALQCVGGCEHRFFVEPANPNGVVFSRGVSSGKACRPDNYTCPQGFRPGGQPGDFMVSRNCIPIIPDKCEPGQTLVNGVCKRTEQCPDGMVQNAAGACEPSKDECPAGQIKGPDGSCVNDNKCPAGQARGKDGSCKKDSDGDGNPDASEDDGKFSGGDSCKEPPQCSGDNILCGQARIQWRIDCNTRKNVSVSGGGCNAEPICTGDKCDALEYAQLLQQWRASCALQKLAGTVSNGQVGTTPGSGTDPNGTVAGGGCDPGYTCSGGNPMLCASLKEQNQMRCAIEKRRAELAQAAGTGDGTDGTGSVIIGDQGTPSLNEGLVSYSGGVPNLSIDVGHGVQITPFGGQFAEYIEMIRFLIIALAMLTAISIIRGN